jgi:hypothetical protein
MVVLEMLVVLVLAAHDTFCQRTKLCQYTIITPPFIQKEAMLLKHFHNINENKGPILFYVLPSSL